MFEIAHDLYHDGLVDDDEIEESDSWFQEVQTSYVAMVAEKYHRFVADYNVKRCAMLGCEVAILGCEGRF